IKVRLRGRHRVHAQRLATQRAIARRAAVAAKVDAAPGRLGNAGVDGRAAIEGFSARVARATEDVTQRGRLRAGEATCATRIARGITHLLLRIEAAGTVVVDHAVGQ